MADIDPELVERALRWCAEAGRQATPAAVKAALAPLTWDQLLAVRALLADPPPLRPLGPFALADIARGAPSDVAAERERAGRYFGAEMDTSAVPAEATSAVPGRPAKAGRGRAKGRPSFVLKRAADRAEPGAPSPSPLPLIEELLVDEGRAALERLVRRHGGKRARLLEALAAGWRRADGRPLDGADLDRALDQHGMARAFETRERDELLHALRAAGGVRARAAEPLGLAREALDEALDRLGARDEAERIREQRRRELRARGTLTQRSHLLLEETDRLADLGLLEEFTRDLAARLPDHVRALTASGSDPAPALLGRSLSLDVAGVERLLQHTGLLLSDLPRAALAPPARTDGRPPRWGKGTAGAGGRPPGRRPSGRPSDAGRPDARRPGPKRADGTPDRTRPEGKRPRAGGRARPEGRPGRRPPGGSRPPKGR